MKHPVCACGLLSCACWDILWRGLLPSFICIGGSGAVGPGSAPPGSDDKIIYMVIWLAYFCSDYCDYMQHTRLCGARGEGGRGGCAPQSDAPQFCEDGWRGCLDEEKCFSEPLTARSFDAPVTLHSISIVIFETLIDCIVATKIKRLNDLIRSR